MLLKSNVPFDPKKTPFFYGYFIAVYSTFCIAMSMPGQTIGLSVFTDYLIQYLKISRFQLSQAYMFGTIGSSLLISNAGKLVNKKGVRGISFFAAVSFGVVLIGMSRIDHLASAVSSLFKSISYIYISMLVVSIGFFFMRFLGQGVLTLIGRVVVMKWFMVKRGRINGVRGAIVTFMFSSSPLFFDFLIRNFGWRGAWFIMGLVICTLGAIGNYLFLRDNPKECGMTPDGRKLEKKPSEEYLHEENWALKEAKGTYTLWIINLSLSICALYVTAMSFHIVSIFEAAGLPREQAISVFLPASFINIIVNLSSGWLSDREYFKTRYKYFIYVFLTGLLVSQVGILTLSTGWGRYIIIIGNGFVGGIFALLLNVVVSRYYGRKHFGAISGFLLSFMVFFSAVGPSIFSWSKSFFNSYQISVFFCMLVVFLLLLGAFKADKPIKK